MNKPDKPRTVSPAGLVRSDLSQAATYREFQFSKPVRAELLRRFGGAAAVIGHIESELEYLRVNAIPSWTRGRDQARECNRISEILVETSKAVGALSEQSRGAMEAFGFGRAKLSTEQLRAELHAHAAAARAHEAKIKSNLTLDAEIKLRVAMAIGQALNSAGYQLNDQRGGLFMLALIEAFKVLVLHGDPRHQARRACDKLGVSIERGATRGRVGRLGHR